jgi:hypothetical protein
MAKKRVTAKKAKKVRRMSHDPNGAMSADEFRHVIDVLDLSQVKAAKFLGVMPRTSRRWAGPGPIPSPVAILLRYMVRNKLTPEDIRPDWREAA